VTKPKPDAKPKLELTTAERKAIILAHWSTDMPVEEILKLVNACPGDQIARRDISSLAHNLGVRRLSSDERPAEAPNKVQSKPLGPERLMWQDAVAWAEVARLQLSDDNMEALATINQRRSQLRLPEFEIIDGAANGVYAIKPRDAPAETTPRRVLNLR